MTAAAVSLEVRRGLLAAAGAYGLWGVAPIFYKLLSMVSVWEVVAQRAVWSAPTAGALLIMMGGAGQLKALIRDPKSLGLLVVTSILVGANWTLFIWAIGNDRVLEASLGYYINPLMTVLLGVAVLREALRPFQVVAIALACVGVAIMTIGVGEAPLVGLGLASTFAVYGYLKKQLPVDAFTALFVEMTLIAAPCVLMLATGYPSGVVAAGDHSLGVWVLLALTGPVTVAPLVLFALGARRLRLSTLGLMQYTAPSMMFFVGVAYGEPFSALHAATFAFIWAGLALFSWDARRSQQSG
ncbi:MAG: EamA family transporter RarD [Pseudomonadota bacterium]